MAVLSRLVRSNFSTFAALRRSLRTTSSSSSPLSDSASSSPTGCRSRGVEKVDSNKGRQVQWVFLGCPGVGKGTYASRLSSLLGVPHIATGDLLREELASSGPLASKVSQFFLKLVLTNWYWN
uniref:adenylate kinase n=1 Tax=Kalanchoe fedtschenkoi TaxID=63787 RepID=A0A7N1A543_KALFE